LSLRLDAREMASRKEFCLPAPDGRGGGSGRHGAGFGRLTLHAGRVEVPIILAVDDVDTVLAALAVLAPQATIIEGAGL